MCSFVVKMLLWQRHPKQMFRKIGVSPARVNLLAGRNIIFIRLGNMSILLGQYCPGIVQSDPWKVWKVLGLWSHGSEEIIVTNVCILSLLSGKRRLDLSGKWGVFCFYFKRVRNRWKFASNHGSCSKKAYLFFISWPRCPLINFGQNGSLGAPGLTQGLYERRL